MHEVYDEQDLPLNNTWCNLFRHRYEGWLALYPKMLSIIFWFDIKTLYIYHLTPSASILWLEVNKYAFTFLSEIRQIQCTRTEFWCVQCLKPAGPSALDKHQIQTSTLDLSNFPSKSKCTLVNPIHTRQKNKIICSCLWKIINKMALKCH